MSFQDYEILEAIGKGSFGKVYKVREKSTSEIYALKKIDIEFLKKTDFEQIEQEIQMLIQMNCEHSNKLYKYFKDKEYYYLILELCDGTLEKEIKKKNGFTIEEIKNILNQLNKVFKVMLKNNIIHRDLKPENILIKYIDEKKNKFKIKLGDYGLARKINKEASTLCGSIITMAPEIQLGYNYTNKCDLWSIGIIIYFMLFVEYPFKNIQEITSNKKRKVCNDDCLNDLMNNLICFSPDKRINWDDYFNHPFFQKNTFDYLNSELDFILCEFHVLKQYLWKHFKLINSFDEVEKENKNCKGRRNENEIKNNCVILIDDKTINFTYTFRFDSEGKYKIRYYFVDNINNFNYLFFDCRELTNLDFSNLNHNNIIDDVSYMFYNCVSLIDLKLDNLNLSSVTNLNWMFYNCNSLKHLDLSKIIINNINQATFMFANCVSLITLNLDGFNITNDSDVSYMFYNCASLNTVSLKNFISNNVNNMWCMFYNCTSLNNLQLGNYNINDIPYLWKIYSGLNK